MKTDVVVDVGNTRLKWGRVLSAARPDAIDGAALAPDDEAAWHAQAAAWSLAPGTRWVVAGVHPARRERFAAWLRGRGDRAVVLEAPDQLPLRVLLDAPHKVGIDRLLDAVAANHYRPANAGAVVIDAGSAVTVDWVDETGAFRGGAILPGFRLMAQALHQYTALLPLVDLGGEPFVPEAPATSTPAAIKAGLYWAVGGGARALIERYAAGARERPAVLVTGGDGYHVWAAVGGTLVRHLTLRGLFLAAEALP